MQKLLLRLNRISAWLLLLGMLVYIISGFGMTKSIIDYNLSMSLHTGWVSYVIILAFVYHSFYAGYLFLKRHNLWGQYAKVGLTAAWSVFALLFVYINNIYNNTGTQSGSQVLGTSINKTQASDIDSIEDNSVNQTVEENEPESDTSYSKSELAAYNGLNGQPAYVAINGNVYDVSSLFKNGTHYSCKAGQEITNSFLKYHVAKILSRFEVVGTYES